MVLIRPDPLPYLAQPGPLGDPVSRVKHVIRLDHPEPRLPELPRGTLSHELEHLPGARRFEDLLRGPVALHTGLLAELVVELLESGLGAPYGSDLLALGHLRFEPALATGQLDAHGFLDEEIFAGFVFATC